MLPGSERRGFASPFRQLLITDWYDGPLVGLAVDADGSLCWFDHLESDDNNSTGVFRVSAVPDARWSDVRSAFRAIEPEGWTQWVLPPSLSAEVDSFIARAEQQAEPAGILAASDLLGTITAWRPMTNLPELTPPQGWLEWLGLARRPGA